MQNDLIGAFVPKKESLKMNFAKNDVIHNI